MHLCCMYDFNGKMKIKDKLEIIYVFSGEKNSLQIFFKTFRCIN